MALKSQAGTPVPPVLARGLARMAGDKAKEKSLQAKIDELLNAQQAETSKKKCEACVRSRNAM